MRRRFLTGATTVVIDQGANSLASLVIAVACASTVSENAFGAFSLATTIILSLQALARASGSETFALVADLSAPTLIDERSALGAVLGLGSTATCLLVMASAVTDGEFSLTLLALSFTVPLILVCDCRRGILLATRRYAAAMRQSVVLFGVASVTVGVLLVIESSEPSTFVLAWGIGCACALAISPRALRAQKPLTWWRNHRRQTGWLVSEALSQSIPGQLSLAAIAGVLGLAALGGFRAALLLFAPVTFLVQGLALLIPAEARRVSARRTVRIVVGTAGALILASGVSAAFFVLPPGVSLSARLLGESAEGAGQVLLAVAVFTAMSSVSIVASLAVRGSGGANVSGRVRMSLAPINAGVPVMVAAISLDVASTVWTMAACQSASAVTWLVVLVKTMQRGSGSAHQFRA